MTRRSAAWTALWYATAAWAPSAQAQHAPHHAALAASNVLSLTASASVEVTMDTLSVAMAATREGADAAVVQSQLRQAVDAALAEARIAARPKAL